MIQFILWVFFLVTCLCLFDFSHHKIRQYLIRRSSSGNGYRMPDKTFFGSAKDAFHISAFGVIWDGWGVFWKTLLRMLIGSDVQMQVSIWAWIYCLSYFLFIMGIIGMIFLVALGRG